MGALQVEYGSEAELASLQQLVAFNREMHRLAQAELPSQVMAACERCALKVGRDTLRQTLQSAVQGRIDSLEKKGGRRDGRPTAPPSAARAGGRATS